jgi:hypothetical protein
VQRYVMRIAIKVHNVLEQLDGNAIHLGFFRCMSSLKIFVPL